MKSKPNTKILSECMDNDDKVFWSAMFSCILSFCGILLFMGILGSYKCGHYGTMTGCIVGFVFDIVFLITSIITFFKTEI